MSATCEAIGPELVAYLDGALADDERRPIASHVSTCLVCRREIERLTTVQRWVSELPAVEPSRDFAATFWERMEEEPPVAERSGRPSRPLRWIVPVLAAAAVLALALRSMVPGTSTPPPTVPAAPAPRAPAVAAAPKIERPKVAAAPVEKPAPAQLANVEDLKPEDLPPELLEHPELFLRLPVVRRLETLEHIDAVKREQQSEDGAG
ncbi:MAG: zf-HC2 domain-containing protein [Candidatus Binatia bacterium]